MAKAEPNDSWSPRSPPCFCVHPTVTTSIKASGCLVQGRAPINTMFILLRFPPLNLYILKSSELRAASPSSLISWTTRLFFFSISANVGTTTVHSYP
jgi:hypothetical protein